VTVVSSGPSEYGSQQATDSKASRFKRVVRSRVGLFLAWTSIAVLLVWQIVTRSVPAYLANDQPEAAILLRSSNPTALVDLAEAEIERHRDPSNASAPITIDPKSRAKIQSWAERAIQNDPLNPQALRILGQLAGLDGDWKRTEAFMEAAARRSLRDGPAVYWMMQKRYEDLDYEEAFRYADMFLRSRSGRAELAVPILAKIAEDAEASGDIVQLLAADPPWRHAFFRRLYGSITDARTPLEIFLALESTSAPPKSSELKAYLNFLIGRGLFDLAYYTWLQFLPTDVISKIGGLFNGNFERTISGMPFDWVFSQSQGVTIEVTEPYGEDGNKALYMKFGPGRVEFPGLRQLVMLPPGRYQLRGKKEVDLLSKRGLKWSVTCVGKQQTQLGESEPINGRDGDWEDFSFSFTVPEDGCAAQYVRMVSDARSASEKFMSGWAWHDDLEIKQE
jgi:hypothetical protein